ncbi:non-ribosomal peptide synthetase [Acaryochloris marina]|uniref:Non-ribosomal peptide synthetase n=1 Tax=Acaryochloris marina (strain MBIC 11017) TaxID=329726 RepID=A8ZKN4_ACAM1|nr:non-ribosomal peptide synthetase [Acaryochloris marina]ABW31352.1 non-ribosomal peptide synthetase [Acaryochloris marina MBIC11017]
MTSELNRDEKRKALRSRLSPAQRAQLDQRLRGDRSSAVNVNAIPRRSTTSPSPLSFAQQRLWFLQQLEPGQAFYNEHAALRLAGELNLAALEHSLNALVERHEVFRTRFDIVHGQPVQVIIPHLALSLAQADLQTVPAADQAEVVQRLSREQSHEPFNLEQAPLLRWLLIWLDEQDYVLLFTIHHIIFDGWSIDILMRELSSFYTTFSAADDSDSSNVLPELPIQYTEYALWQRQWLQGDVLQAQLDYWRRQLAQAPPLLNLPSDRPRPAIQTYRGKAQTFQLSQPMAQALKDLSRQTGLTLFMTLLTSFKILLHRYTEQTDLIVGSPVANRNRAEVEGLIGVFVNSLVLRTDLSGNPTVAELMQRVRRVLLGAYANSELPFEKLVEELQPERDTHSNPLFQVSFTLHNTPRQAVELSGLTLTPVEVSRDRALLDLRLDMTETEQGLTGCWEYSTDLFDDDRIERMSGHYQKLLEMMVANQAQHIADLSLLTESEFHQLMQWNQTQADYPQDRCLSELFATQVEQTPDAIALIFEDQHLTYAELNARANQLAHYLQTLGVKPDDLVGICCDRSLDMMIGLLGILKSGGAYVPIDPDYPSDRLAWMMSDAHLAILLTQRSLTDQLPPHQAQVVELDGDWQTIAQQPRHNLANLATADHLAYVIYTSGSTGKPKGVQITHRSLVNFLCSMHKQPGLTADDTLLAITSISFDIAALELYLPLITGAKVVVASRTVAADGEQLSELLSRTGATIMQATPATWRMLLTAGWSGQAGLKMLCGGEALSGDLAQQLMNMGTSVWNLYGPTETTIWSTIYPVKNQPHNHTDSEVPFTKGDLGGSIPIGHPIANTQIYLLDRHGQPVPVGVPGELHIGGDGLARGYLNRPELTAERFIDFGLPIADFGLEPDSQIPPKSEIVRLSAHDEVQNPKSVRLYKTGDLARYRPDGSIEYLGRLDHQVKIRGFRIELGEIEAVLRQHSDVHEVVAISRPDLFGESQLVAYLVCQPERQVDSGELRKFLRAKLPDYMVPATYMTLEALPLTPNGKVDRKALPAPTPELRMIDADASPASPIEDMLAGVWAATLGLEGVGRYDNFFELGGHSLLATQVMSQIQRLLQVEVPLRSLFESPTVAQLAERVEAAIQTGASLSIPAIQSRSNRDVAPLSFAQERMWFLAQLEPENPFYNLPIAVALDGLLDLDALEQTLTEILRRHQGLRTRIETRVGVAIARIADPVPFPLRRVDLSQSASLDREPEIQRWIDTAARQPFDLQQDLLLRATVLRLSEQEHILLLTLHHIAADAWSFGLLASEISALYPAFCDGNPSPLPELPIQYGDVAVWQRQWLQGNALQTQMDYWRQQLQDAPALLNLPTDYPRPAVQTYRGARYGFELSASLTRSLHHLSQQAGCTLFMTLLAAFKLLLGRYSNSTDILVGTPIANRNRAEVEDLIGCFVNTLVLRTDLSHQPTVLKLLERVREVALGAYAHQDLPFEQLVDGLQLGRSLSHTPLFQVMFVLQNTPLPQVTLPNLQIHPLDTGSGTTQFDLTLSLEETPAGLTGVIEYNCDLFEEATITRMAGHYQMLLDGFVAHPQRPVAELPCLTTAEQQQLVAWNQTQAVYSQDACIHHLFEAQVERIPDAIAVVFQDQQLTYGELNQRANQLAQKLRSQGVQPDVPVGICVERSIDMLVALLGVLKAGGAYLPLDPTYPSERLAFMLDDAQVKHLVTQSALCDRIPPHQAQVVYLDRLATENSRPDSGNPIHSPQTENLAYVIYTSGSTGKPKGVMVNHRSLVNYTEAIASAYVLKPSDRVLQFASINFDVAAEEIFPTLAQGGTLVLRTDEMLDSIPTFLHQVQALELTVLNLPTAFWHQFTAELDRMSTTVPDSLRLVVIGGERALADRVQTWHRVVGEQIRLVNCYGPTEATIGATLCDLTAYAPTEWAGNESGATILSSNDVPIGKPIQNVQTYVLNADLQPVPIGIPGELYIGGDGLARGYLNRPELTAERFVDLRLPISNSKFKTQNSKLSPSICLYKTGDLVRYRPDGNLEYLGRIDHQVKMRGFRIELGEIEAALGQHPAVQNAVVVDDETELGTRRLVAYGVAMPYADLSMPELRQFLTEKLPAYMVPAVFVLLETLPLMPNGKVNRQALPAPDATQAESDATVASPRTPTEITLAEIWAQVLSVTQVGIHDNFFELGGDSILSLQVVARSHQAGLQFTPKQLFEHQTIAELAIVAQTKHETEIEQGLATGSVGLTPIQQWFFEQQLPDPHHFNQAVLLEVPQPLDPGLLEQAVQQVLIHHDALRLRFEPIESSWRQEYAPPDSALLLIRWDFSTLSKAEQQAAFATAAAELHTSLDLSKGPLLRVGYFDWGDHLSDSLLIVIHHLVVDGVSWRILLEDLQTAYQHLSRGETVQLPAKTLSFQQWSQQLQQMAQTVLDSSEPDYWLAQQSSTPLPVDIVGAEKAGAENTVASAATVHCILSMAETQALLKEVPSVYNTEINDVLLTALVQTLTAWVEPDAAIHSPTFLIDLEGHGREGITANLNVSRTVGWFTTVFPVALSLDPNVHPGEALKQVKEQLRRIPHQGLGYRLLRYLSEEPSLTAALKNLPQANILFNYLGQFDSALTDTALFRPLSESAGPTQSPRGQRSHWLEINCWVSGGQLHLDWIYSQALHQSSTMETLAQQFMETLRSLIAHCQSPDAGGYTPSDFSEADLSQDDLDRFLAHLNRRS